VKASLVTQLADANRGDAEDGADLRWSQVVLHVERELVVKKNHGIVTFKVGRR
jgi:hypothetical protein